ncbi:glycosyltransferase [Aquisalinus flavus]|uniref:Glycosyl transferase family 1 domain-containing protein n=1 Tax=Aquisalinus flavus TaxID=1526572 RepID=A0A8J2V7K1_9PROT|nr:glycosyltransferase [Aquisalinus flavus]MBD0426223.1 glycosyltransferase [Aquisalinus flavus]GGD09621.1 hypothetical protein GCM10011342_18140 [Aquisalinus flavus]
MTKTAYFTICSRNYMAYALTLYHSLKKAEPDSAFYCFLVDAPDGTQDLPFPVIACETMNIRGFWDMAFRYTVMEFNTAVKPFCIDYLFDRAKVDAAVYLDPDLYIVRPLTHVHEALENGADIVLTPHALAPLDDGGDPDDVRLMRTGAYNLGFGAFSRSRSSRALVTWWGEQLRTKCVVDLENGLFVDQKFMDLAPCYVDKTAILRHPGYNVAYWNMPHREIAADDGWTVNGEPLHFFHFSGVVPGDGSVFSKHQNRYTAATIGPLKSLLDDYLAGLAGNDHETWKTIPYAYNYFPDGSYIADPLRRAYARNFPQTKPGGREILQDHPALFNATSRRAQRPGCTVPLTTVMYEVWASRSDLRDVFDLNTDQSRIGYLNWFLSSAPSEVRLEEKWLAPAREILSARSQTGTPPVQSGLNLPAMGRTRPTLRATVSRAVLAGAHRLRPLYRHVSPELRQRIVRLLLREGFSGPAGEDNRLAPPAPAPEKAPLDDGLNVFGYFRTESGLGEGARLALRALGEAGVEAAPVTLRTQIFRDALADVDDQDTLPPVRRINLLHVNADEMLTISRRVNESYLDRSYNIGYWAWELENFPEPWSEALDQVDEVWTPSTFVEKSIQARTGKPVMAMPHPLRDRPADMAAAGAFRKAHDIDSDTFLVLTTFDLNSYIDRKNPFAAIAAFKQAFGDSQNAALLMKFHGDKAMKAQRRRLAEAKGEDPRILLVDDVLSSAEMAAMQMSANAFLSLHRSEGFGLNMAECMLREKPVIATGYSGNMDYMTARNSLLVDYAMIPVGQGQYPFPDGQQWADPDVDHAASLLKRVHDDPSAFSEMTREARQTILRDYSAQAIGTRMRERLAAIRQDLD